MKLTMRHHTTHKKQIFYSTVPGYFTLLEQRNLQSVFIASPFIMPFPNNIIWETGFASLTHQFLLGLRVQIRNLCLVVSRMKKTQSRGKS